jgi:hypothetical protein
MTQPSENSAAAGLVEQQGVTGAGAAAGDHAAAADVRSGGHPGAAAQMDVAPDREEIVGPPDQQAGGPGQELAAGEG